MLNCFYFILRMFDQEEEYIQLIQCPLQIFVTGNKSPGADNSVKLAKDQMSSKDRCIKLLWTSLDCLSRLQKFVWFCELSVSCFSFN